MDTKEKVLQAYRVLSKTFPNVTDRQIAKKTGLGFECVKRCRQRLTHSGLWPGRSLQRPRRQISDEIIKYILIRANFRPCPGYVEISQNVWDKFQHLLDPTTVGNIIRREEFSWLANVQDRIYSEARREFQTRFNNAPYKGIPVKKILDGRMRT